MPGPLSIAVFTALASVVIELSPGQDPPPIAPSAYVMVDAGGTKTLHDVTASQDAFRRNVGAIVNPGMPRGTTWVHLEVRNAGTRSGEWVLSLNRFAVAAAEIFLVDSTGTRTLLADSAGSFAASFRTFRTLAAAFRLRPGQAATLYIHYRGANWSGLDLSLTTRATHEHIVTRNLLVFMLLLGGIGSLVLFGSISFVLLGHQVALLYALGQLAFFVFYAHLGGFTTVYLWPDTPQYGRILAPLGLVTFATAMAQFARRFFDTGSVAPRLDWLLKTYVGAGCVAVAMLPLDYVIPQLDPRFAVDLVYAQTFATWLTLPCLAVYAALHQHDYWPIAIAWCVVGGFLVAALLVFAGVITIIPLGKEAYAVVVYTEALFLALAITLRIRRIRDEREGVERQLSHSLKAELEASQRATQLAEEREWAIRDLAEKGRLLLAAGHDTRQMLSALRHFAVGLQRAGTGARVAHAGREINTIADSLNEVLSTAIEGSSSGGMGDEVLALELLRPAQILTPLAMIHGATASDKAIDLRIRTTNRELVTDRVLVSRILGNFVANAVKFTDSGTVLVTCRRAAAGHRFQVFDTGHGLHPDALAQLLDPDTGAVHFGERADGSGTGFHIAKHLAVRLGATIGGRSILGRGSVFELFVPTEPAGTARGVFDEIVLADNDREQRTSITQLAQQLGISVRLAPTEPAALGRSHHPRLVLIDQHFGGTDGGCLYAERLAALAPDAVTALLTYDRSIDVRMKFARISQLVVYKPVESALLAATTTRASRLIASRTDHVQGALRSGATAP
jgi:two-component system, sensor histidine kinase LadS